MAKVMSFGLLACAVVLASEPVRAADAPAAKRQRSAVVLKHGDAKAVAETLGKHFKGDAEVQVLADRATNSLLISAPEKLHAEAVRLASDLDRRPKTVAIDVLICDLRSKKGEEPKIDRTTFRGPSAEVWKRVEELRKKGVVVSTRRYSLAVLENEPAMVTTGETKPSVTGVGGGGFGGRGGAPSRSVTYRDLGASVEVTARLTGDREAQVGLTVKDSRASKPEGGVVLGKDENGGSVIASEFLNVTLKTRLAVPVGHAAPAHSTVGEAGSGQTMTVVIVAARVVEPASSKDD